ncbi:MAG TPA: tRNA (guanosine(46)-N7)-methyltransferase TrmB [Kineosporiaceae bacterium]
MAPATPVTPGTGPGVRPSGAEANPLRSFKHRRGRITPGQRTALDSLWSRYGLPSGPHERVPIDPREAFGRAAPLVVEIGFGMGETTVAMAAADPGRDLLAIDVHTPGVGALLRDAAALGLTNLRVVIGDGVDVLRYRVAPGSLDEIRVYFPDPWPKQRHHKRRLISTVFARLAAECLRPGGRLHCATDWTPYAERMLQVVAAEPLLVNSFGGYARRPAWRPETRFERLGLARGHSVHDVIAHRRQAPGGTPGAAVPAPFTAS